MANLYRGYTFGATEQVTATKLSYLVDHGSADGIVNADISGSAAIADSKLATITTAGKVTEAAINLIAGAGKVNGAALTGLAFIPDAAGVIPAANLTSVAQKGANSDITSLTGLTTALSTGQGGTGSTANANAASGVVVLDSSSKLPAVDGSLLTGIASGTIKIGTYTGTTANKSLAHGLGVIPSTFFCCRADGTGNSVIWFNGLGTGAINMANNNTQSNCFSAVPDATNVYLYGNNQYTNENGKTYYYITMVSS
jgi:hypothetical protein